MLIVSRAGLSLIWKQVDNYTSFLGLTKEIQQSPVVEKELFSEKEHKLEVTKDNKHVKTPQEVVPVVRSSANCNFEELASKTKSVYR